MSVSVCEHIASIGCGTDESFPHGVGLPAEIAASLVLGIIRPDGVVEESMFAREHKMDMYADSLVDGLACYLRLRDGDILRVAHLLEAGATLPRLAVTA